MKKIMMTLAAVAVAATMNAQVWMGGELTISGSHTNGSDNTDKVFTIAPEIGYNLNDNFAVAVKLGFSHASTKEIAGNAFSNVNAYSVNPYVRYNFVKAGNFAAFVDGGIGYTTLHVQGADKNFNQVGVSVVPGISYAVSEKVGLVAHLGEGLYFKHTWLKDAVRNNSYGLNLFNGISFGAYYNF